MKTDNYRRKDYVFPRSMREAFGYDETFEPEIRCCSELLYQKQSADKLSAFVPLYVLVVAVAAFVWWML